MVPGIQQKVDALMSAYPNLSKRTASGLARNLGWLSLADLGHWVATASPDDFARLRYLGPKAVSEICAARVGLDIPPCNWVGEGVPA